MPVELWAWLIDDREPTSEPELRQPEEGEEVSDAVIAAYSDYLDAWRDWTTKHGPKIPLLALYERLFRIKQQADQLGERYETIVGAGLACVPETEQGRVRRHLLTVRAEVNYEPQTGRITVRPAADGMSLEFEDEMLDPSFVPAKELRDSVEAMLEAAGGDLWSAGTLNEALRMWTQAMRHDAVFDPRVEPPGSQPDSLVVFLAPALILRKRTARSLLAFYEKVDAELDAGTLVPGLVAGLVAEPDDRGRSDGERHSVLLLQDDELYFPKPHNDEQLDVLRRLATSDGVVVVGPPGTGKSHTIANLVSHLLAHGQKVLVTSHTSRALEVLLDKLPPEIRSLSVNLVGDGRVGMRELQHSVGAIVNRASDPEWLPSKIDQRVARYRELRERAREERGRHLAAIREIREGDAQVHEPSLGTYRGTLAQIAARIADERETFGWASDISGESPSITDDEAAQLVELAKSITPDLENLGRNPIPELPSIEDFTDLCRRIADLEDAVVAGGESRQVPSAPALAGASHQDRTALAQGIDRLQRGRATVTVAEGWELPAFEAALGGPVAKWHERRTRTNEWIVTLREAAPVADGLIVTGSLSAEPAAARAAAQALAAHLEAGRTLGFAFLRPRVLKEARAALGTLRVAGQEPASIVVLKRVVAWLDARIATERAREAWSGERVLVDDAPYSVLANLEELLPGIDRVLAAEACRADIVAVAARIPGLPLPAWTDDMAWSALRRAALGVDAEEELREARADLTRIKARVDASVIAEAGDLVPAAVAAIEARDPRAFVAIAARIDERKELAGRIRRRDDLFARLTAQTPVPTLSQLATEAPWEERLPRYAAAFWWGRAESWLRDVLDASSGGAASRVAVLNDEIRGLTASIGEHLAWRTCLLSLTAAQRQHLTLYQKAMAKYGQGKGKFAAKFLAAAQSELEECRTSVPAWIMPTYRVAESLSPASDAFDVVIVDEASQSGVDALFLWWLAAKVVIVGDDEQISPDAVGLELEPVFKLRDQLLADQPVGSVISPTTSLFDLGEIAFTGNRTHLREHFRCMPEIIAFSNRISYSHAPLEPLRQFGADRLPPLRSMHVSGATKTAGVRGNLNRDEAHRVVDTIVDCTSRPEYDGRTMGVISLTGEYQARYVERLLLERLGPDELLRRRLKCGDAYAFQGDERDVMFLSMVAVPTDHGNRLAALTADPYRRRFNVAASRARDQMWLFHSVTQADLNPDCLRWKLLEHFTHTEGVDVPDLGVVTERDPHPSFDSLFEQRVYLRLHARGYRVRPQVEAYGYRIDLVVIGGESRLAVECDGDEWHGPERFERDLARQQDLERVGWRFVRIRETEFYFDPEEALRPLWSKLAELGIRPVGAAAERGADETQDAIDTTDIESVVNALLDPFALSANDGEHAVPALDAATVIAQSPELAKAITTGLAGGERGSVRASDEATPAGPRAFGLVMARYVAWESHRISDPRYARQSELVEAMLEVVSAEGPVLARRAYRLIMQAAGFQRLVHTVVSPLNKAAVRAEREGRLVTFPSGVGHTLADRLLRLPSQPTVVVRERGPRDLEEIPASEIQEVARQLRGDHFNPVDRALMREILARYDRVALTNAASAYIEKCLGAKIVLGPAPVAQAAIWVTQKPAPPSERLQRRLPEGAVSVTAVAPPAQPATLDFRTVLSDTIARAKGLQAAARSRLATSWKDEEVDRERQTVIGAAGRAGAPRDWSTVARIVSSTLADWPAPARGAVVDAAFAQVATGVPEEAALLLVPWRAGLEERGTVPQGPRWPAEERACRHGKPMGSCEFIACEGHPLGGMYLDAN